MTVPSGISHSLSTIARRSLQLRPMVTFERMTESSISPNECTRTLVNSRERRTSEPETIVPPETSELSAVPRRPSSSSTNLAGATCSWYVQIGQVES